MRLLGTLVCLALLAGCSAAGDTNTIRGYELYTHCGIKTIYHEGRYYNADPVLDDGNGNPPDGWGNPSQVGTLTINDDGTLDFVAGELKAHFTAASGPLHRETCS